MRLARHVQLTRALLHYRGEVESVGVPVLANGVPGQFSRSSTRWAVDRSGVLHQVAAGQLAQHTLFDANGAAVSSGVLTGPAQVNLVTNPNDINAANGWSVGGALTPTTGLGPYAGVPFTRLAGPSTSDTAYRAVTLTGDGTKCAVWLVKYDGSPGTFRLSTIDFTTSVTQIDLRPTWNSDGSLTLPSATVGTLLSMQRVKDGVYLLIASGTGFIATNINRIYAIRNLATATSTSILVAGVTLVDAPTVAVPFGQSSADFLRFACSFAPQSLTALVDFTSLGWESVVSARLLDVGNPASSGDYSRLRIIQNTTNAAFQWLSATDGVATGSNSANGLPVFGQRAKLRSTLSSIGHARLFASYAAASEVIGSNGTPRALDPAFGGVGPIISIGCSTLNGSHGAVLLHGLKFANGDLSLPQMESLF